MAHLVLAGNGMSSGLRFRAIVDMVVVKTIQMVRVLRARHAVFGLYRFDERMLKDIGLTYSDVTAALDCPMNEDPSRHLASVAAGRAQIKR